MNVSSQIHTISLYPQEKKKNSAHSKWDWVGPRGSLDTVEKMKISCPARNQTPDHPPMAHSLYCGTVTAETIASRQYSEEY
jgi:hypothetical protein